MSKLNVIGERVEVSNLEDIGLELVSASRAPAGMGVAGSVILRQTYPVDNGKVEIGTYRLPIINRRDGSGEFVGAISLYTPEGGTTVVQSSFTRGVADLILQTWRREMAKGMAIDAVGGTGVGSVSGPIVDTTDE